MRIEVLLSKASKLVKQGKNPETIEILKQVLAKYPKNIKAQKLWASLNPQARFEIELQLLIKLFQQQMFIETVEKAESMLHDFDGHAKISCTKLELSMKLL